MTKKEIDSMKVQLLHRLLEISDNNISYLGMSVNVPFQTISLWRKNDMITDRGVKFVMESELADEVPPALKEYITNKYKYKNKYEYKNK